MLKTPSWFLAVALLVAPAAGLAQPQLGPMELARAKTLLELYKAELSAEQYALLSGKLAETQQAYVELTAVSEEVATVAAAAETGAGAAAATRVVAVSGISDVLGFLAFVLPSTAQAPGMKEEKPKVLAARAKLEQRAKELAEATKKVDKELQAAVAKQPKATLERCLDACDGDPDTRRAFCGTLRPRDRKRCYDKLGQSAQVCKGLCYDIFVK